MPRAFDVPLILGAAFVMGSAIGSFANVCIYRMPRKRKFQEELGLKESDILPDDHSIVRPRSFCPGCRRGIPWWDNIPILSYALLNGRCRSCKTPIPFRYPLVEALTGALFALCAWRHLADPGGTPPAVLGVMLLIVTALVIITFIDIDFRVIPDEISLGGALLAVPLSLAVPALHVKAWPPFSGAPAVGPWEAAQASLAGILAGAGAIYVMHLVGVGYLRLKALLKHLPWDPDKAVVGGGDLKMMAAVGGLLGWQAALLTVFFLAPVFGAGVGIVYMILTRDEYIAYGPFLALGTLIVMLTRREILGFLSEALVTRT